MRRGERGGEEERGEGSGSGRKSLEYCVYGDGKPHSLGQPMPQRFSSQPISVHFGLSSMAIHTRQQNLENQSSPSWDSFGVNRGEEVGIDRVAVEGVRGKEKNKRDER